MYVFTYLKFLTIKGTHFQTRAILAFDQAYCATEALENFRWGSKSDGLSAQYFDATVAKCPSSIGKTHMDCRSSTGEKFYFHCNFNSAGCPNPQSCQYKHVCIDCSSEKHKGKSCTGTSRPASAAAHNNWPNSAFAPQAKFSSTATITNSTHVDSDLAPLVGCPLYFHAWKQELASDTDKDFILDGLHTGFKLILESDPSFITDFELDNYSSATCMEFKAEMDRLFSKELAPGHISWVDIKPLCSPYRPCS